MAFYKPKNVENLGGKKIFPHPHGEKAADGSVKKLTLKQSQTAHDSKTKPEKKRDWALDPNGKPHEWHSGKDSSDELAKADGDNIFRKESKLTYSSLASRIEAKFLLSDSSRALMERSDLFIGTQDLEHTKPAPWGGSIPPELLQVHEKAHSYSKIAHSHSKKAAGHGKSVDRMESRKAHLQAHASHADASHAHLEAEDKAMRVGHGGLARHHKKAANLHDRRAVGHFLAAHSDLKAHRKSLIGEALECMATDKSVTDDKKLPTKPLLKEKFRKSGLTSKENKNRVESTSSYQGSNKENGMNKTRIEEMKRLAGDGAPKPVVKRAGEGLGGSGGEVGANEPAPSREMRDVGGKASGMGKAAAQYKPAPATEGTVGADLGDDTTSGGEVGDRDMSVASKKPRDIGGSDDSKENGEKFAAKAEPDQAGSKYKPVSAPATADAGAELGEPTTTGGEVGDEKKDVASKKMRDTGPHEAPLPKGQKKPAVKESTEYATITTNLKRLMGLLR